MQMIGKDNMHDRYYPYTSRDDKIEAYKKAILHSLDLVVHPDHLERVEKKLKALKKYWKDELQREEGK